MGDVLWRILGWLSGASEWAVYVMLAIAAALENIVPPIPADAVVVFGGVLAGRGVADPWAVFVVVWLANVAGALLVYGAGVRYGPGFFAGRLGRLILNPGQVQRLSEFYGRFGLGVIFVSRFLPMFRAVVPVFAGVSRMGFWRVVPPLAAASGLWYGLLVYLGTIAGRNWRSMLERLGSLGGWFWALALVAAAGVAWWWWRSR